MTPLERAARAAGLGPRARDAGAPPAGDSTWVVPFIFAGLAVVVYATGKDAERVAQRRRAQARAWGRS